MKLRLQVGALVDGPAARLEDRQGVVYDVTDEDVCLIEVSPFSRDAVVCAIRLDIVVEARGTLADPAMREWFASQEISRELRWSGHEGYDAR